MKSDDEINNAKFDEAADFLENVLKIKLVNGEGKNRIFRHTEAQAIRIINVSFSPILNKKPDNTDYVIVGGTFNICFRKNQYQLGGIYAVDISSEANHGIVGRQDVLPAANQISINNFNIIPGFTVGKPKSVFTVGRDLTQDFKTNVNEGNIIQGIADLIQQGDLKIKVSEAAGIGNFVKGDTIKIKLSIGEVRFTTEYTLTI